MPFTVFYAWQSDRDQEVCRYLIRHATKAAIRQLAADVTVASAPAFDHATEGETGLVHIAETIKRKIRRSGVFLADLTFAGEYASDDKRQKRVTNANVAIELGYAMRVKNPKQFILVMNTHYGPPEDLPFDLRHYSFPLQYTLAAGIHRNSLEFKAARQRLKDDIAKALREVISLGVIQDAEVSKIVAVKVTCQKVDANGARHMRWLVVDLENRRDELNDVFVTLDYPGQDGKPIRQKLQAHGGDPPTPFPKGFSFRFITPNDDPSKPVDAIINIPPNQIIVTIHSRIREVARVPATRWLKELEAFRQPDPTMPPKPPPSYSARDAWITRYRDRW